MAESIVESQNLNKFSDFHKHKLTQRLQFRCRDDGYHRVVDLNIVDQPSKQRGILNNEFAVCTTNANAYKVRQVYCDPKTSSTANKQQRLKCRATRVDYAFQRDV